MLIYIMTKNGSMKMSGGGNKSQGLPATTNMRSGPIRNYVFSQAYSPLEKRQIQVPLVTGGTKSSYTDSSGEKWILHTFSTSGFFTLPSGLNLPIQALIIGGGGGGGAANASSENPPNTSFSAAGGGGGGGEVISISTTINAAISVVVGTGGQGGTASVYTGPTNGNGTLAETDGDTAWSNNGGVATQGSDGQYSSFDSTVASGGKGGKAGILSLAFPSDVRYAKGGDSGNATGQGGNGSYLYQNTGSGGGGGGSSGSNGGSGGTSGGDGGGGTLSSITNVSIEYGRGGGGGVTNLPSPAANPGNYTTGDNNSGRGGNSSAGAVTTTTPGVFSTWYSQQDSINYPPTVGTRPGNGGGGASSASFYLRNAGAGGPSKNLGPNPGANGADGAVYVRYKYSDLIA